MSPSWHSTSWLRRVLLAFACGWRHHQGEIDLLKTLDHKHIVKYLGLVDSDNHINMILEYAVCTTTTMRASKFVVWLCSHQARFEQVRGERLAPTDDQQARRVSREPGGHLRRADAQGPHLPPREERHTQVAFRSFLHSFLVLTVGLTVTDPLALPPSAATIITITFITGTSRPPIF